jgi:hypothetical protein
VTYHTGANTVGHKESHLVKDLKGFLSRSFLWYAIMYLPRHVQEARFEPEAEVHFNALQLLDTGRHFKVQFSSGKRLVI